MTPLDLVLRGLGFTTDCCVRTTVYDASAHDYEVHLVKDMCASTNDGSPKSAVLMANWVDDIEICNSTAVVKQGEALHVVALLRARPEAVQRSTCERGVRLTGMTPAGERARCRSSSTASGRRCARAREATFTCPSSSACPPAAPRCRSA